jgi:hypothetical protein
MNTAARSNFSRLITLFRERQFYTFDQSNFWAKNRMLLLASLSVFVGVLLWRSWPNFSHPGLYVEDTSHYFNHFYGDTRGISALLHNPNGYYNILNNLIALLVAKLDVRLQPTFYLWTGTFLATLAVMILPCSGLLKNKYLIFIAPFLLGFSGLNHLYYYITLAYQIYTLVIILLGLLFWQPLKGNGSNVLLFILLSLLIWSGPYSVLVVPFSLFYILFFRGKTWLLLFLSLVTILYALSVTEHTILLRMLWKPEIHRIWFNTLICKVFFMGMKGDIGPQKIMFTAAFFLAIIAILRKDFFYLKIACILLVLINSSLAALFLSKKFMLALKIRPCYLVVAQFLWLFFLLFTADRILARSKKLYHGGIIICVLAVLFIYRDNLYTPWKRSIPVMTMLPKYLERVYEGEQQNLAEQNRVQRIEFGNEQFRPSVMLGRVGDPTIPVELIRVDD